MLWAEARIKHDLYPLAALQAGGLFNIIFGKPAKFVFFTDQPLIFMKQHRARVNQQFAAIAIHHQHTVMQYRRLDIRAHHGGNAHRTHHNSGMGVGGTVAYDDAHQPVLRQLGERRGGKLIRHQHKTLGPGVRALNVIV